MVQLTLMYVNFIRLSEQGMNIYTFLLSVFVYREIENLQECQIYFVFVLFAVT